MRVSEQRARRARSSARRPWTCAKSSARSRRSEALLEFLSIRDRLVTFVVTRDRVAWRVGAHRQGRARRAGEVGAIDRARTGLATDEAPLRALHALLVAPLEREHLLDGVHDLVVVTHGALAYLPFSALRGERAAGSRYLVEDYDVETLSSASALAALRARAPALASSGASVLAPLPVELPGSREEASSSPPRTPASTPIDRRRRDRAGAAHRARPSGRRPRRHATACSTRGARCSPASGSSRRAAMSRADNDGRLETHEVLALDVRSRLVFLSGCETALGPAWSTSFERTEDYVTLAQAFLFAGAQNVVATLWRIEDHSAAELADAFYRSLADEVTGRGARRGAAIAHSERAILAAVLLGGVRRERERVPRVRDGACGGSTHALRSARQDALSNRSFTRRRGERREDRERPWRDAGWMPTPKLSYLESWMER